MPQPSAKIAPTGHVGCMAVFGGNAVYYLLCLSVRLRHTEMILGLVALNGS